MLKLSNVEIKVGDCHLADLTMEIETGEHVFLMGRSGVGKTLVLETIAGRWAPVSGEITLDGARLDTLPAKDRAVGLLYQDYLLFDFLDAQDNVALPLIFVGTRKKEARAHARELLESFGIAHLAHRDVKTLSGGERQRVALARAFATNPRLLLLDEPYAALDEKTKRLVRATTLSEAHKRNLTIIEVTHDPADVGDNRCYMIDG